MSSHYDTEEESESIGQYIKENKNIPTRKESEKNESLKLDSQIADKTKSKGNTTQEKYATKEHSTQDTYSVKLTQEVLYGLETIFQPKLDAIERLLQQRLHTIEIMLQEKFEEASHKKLEAVDCAVDASQLKRVEAAQAQAAEESPADRWEAIEVLSPGDIGQIEMFPDQYEKVKDLDFIER